MTTENQTQTPEQTNSPTSQAQAPNQGESQQTGTGAGESGAPAADAANAGEQAAAQAATEKAAADKAASDAAAAEKALTDKLTKDMQAKAQADMQAAITSWKDAVKGDPDLGGVKYDATVIDVEAGIKAVGTEGLAKLLESTGLKHHPDVARAFAKVGALTREGVIRVGSTPRDKPKSIADILYDKTPA